MSKILVLLLVGALVSLSAQAQSSVTVYGVLDVFAQHLDGETRQTRLQSSGIAGSRLGVRGTEDLGDGLHAVFTLEMGLNADDGTLAQGGLAFGRQAFAGLAGHWGELTLGRQYGSTYRLGAEFSAFGIGSAGPSTLTLGGFAGGYEPFRGASGNATPPAASATGNGGPARINESIRYASPRWADWQATAIVGLGEASGAPGANRLIDVSLRYAAGGLDVLGFYVSDKRRSASASTDVVTTGLGAICPLPMGYRLLAGAVSVDDRRPDNDDDGLGYWVAGDHSWGVHTVRVQWLQNRPRHGEDNRTSAWGIGYQLDLSKRTALFSSLTRFANGAHAGAGGLGRFSAPIPAGITSPGHADIAEWVAGIRHIF